jgi:hypothetical protein
LFAVPQRFMTQPSDLLSSVILEERSDEESAFPFLIE